MRIHTQTKTYLSRLSVIVFCLAAVNVFSNSAKAQRGLPVTIPSGTSSSSGKIEGDLSKLGPQIVGSYLLSDISATVFAKAENMVIEYKLGDDTSATLTLTSKKNKEPFTFLFPPTSGLVHQEVFSLPKTWGKDPVVALLSIKATNINPLDKKPPHFELYALGLGNRAVGSFKIDQLDFQPPSVPATGKIKVTYGFHSLADFDKAAAQFWYLGYDSQGAPASRMVNQQMISGAIRRDEKKSGVWEGKDTKGKVSKGRHILYIKAWLEKSHGGDWTWVSDPSRQRVEIG